MTYRIYSLHDNPDVVRYIGITIKTLKHRLSQHLTQSRHYDNYKDRWIRKCVAEGKSISIQLVEETEDPDRERYWIKHYKDSGEPLTNTTSGGDGARDVPPELRERAAAKRRGVPLSAETRRRLSIANTGKRHSPETIEKMRLIHTGRKHGPHSEDVKRKMSQAKMGHTVSIETREKLRQANIGKTRPKPTHCRNGHEYTPENTFTNVRGAIECRICQRVRYARSHKKRKDAGLI